MPLDLSNAVQQMQDKENGQVEANGGQSQTVLAKQDTMDAISIEDMEMEVDIAPKPNLAMGNLNSVLKLRSIATKWKKKAIKKNNLNMAFDDSPEILSIDNCHSFYWTKRRCVPLKNYHDEARAEKDISKFLENPNVLFKVRGQIWKDIAREMLENINLVKPNYNLDVKKAYECLMSTANDFTIPEMLQGLVHNETSDVISDQSFIVVLGDTPAIPETHTSFAILPSNLNLGPSMSEVRVICLVLSPVKSKQTKSGIEVGRTYSTLLSEKSLRRKLLETKTPEEFAEIVKEGCSTVREKDKKHYQKEKKETQQEIEGEEEISAFKKFISDIMPPGKLLLRDIKRRKKHYWSDFTDGMNDRESVKKYITTIIFLYFILLLPVMAFGVLNSYNTHQAIETRKGILAQAFGGIIFALFAGQPLSVVQSTIPIVLFIKLVYTFGVTLFNVDFLTFYMLVGLWNGFFLICYSFTGVSMAMAYCSRSTEEIVGLFTSIAFVVDSLKYVSKSFDEYWCSGEGCDKSVALGIFIVVFGVLFIAVQIYNFKWSPYLSTGKRKMVAEFALPFSVLIMSFVGSYLMGDVKLGFFTDEEYEMDPIYTSFDYEPMKYHGCPSEQSSNYKRAAAPTEPCSPINAGSFITAMALGFIVSMLFFVEANVAASMVNSHHNKLKKGSAYHLDLLVTAIINIILSIFGLPWMHACLPTSPMHVRGLADIEESVEHGYVRETVLMVRETRITTLVANVLVFISLLLIPIPLQYIPIPALYGVLLFLAAFSLSDFQMWERVLLMFTEQSLYPPIHYVKKVPQKAVHTFTALQLLQLGFLCGLSFSGVAYLKMFFPFIIIALIPIRKFLIPKIIEEDHLDALDGSH